MPYITASIVVQLAAALSPSLAALKKEGESGRKTLNQYTRYGTVALTAIQGYFIAVGLATLGASQGIAAVLDPGTMFRVSAALSIVAAPHCRIGLAAQTTHSGTGNAASLCTLAATPTHL